MKPKLLVITPVKHILGVCAKLESYCDVTYIDNPNRDEIFSIINKYESIFTNPNKSKIFETNGECSKKIDGFGTVNGTVWG